MLIDGGVYRIAGRRQVIGIWRENSKSFDGIQWEFGSPVEYYEMHADHGGSAREIQFLFMMPDLSENEAFAMFLVMDGRYKQIYCYS